VTRIGINGFGRMGRLSLRAAWDWPDLTFAHVNEIAGDAATAAHLLAFDSIHGRFDRDAAGAGETLAIDEITRLELPAASVQAPLLKPPTEGDDIVGDYASLGLTLRRHPLALLRDRLKRLRIRTATDVAQARNGQFIRAAGIVTCRQRPATASGVIFVTLEDETGYVNAIVWNALADRQRRVLIGSRLLVVSGEVQREGRVVHILARRLEDLSPMLGRLATSSHDFH